MPKKTTGNKIDVEVGKRLRTLRIARRLSQTDLAKALDLSFQQIQKYEKGTNRIGPSRLIPLAKLLKCEPADIIGGGLPSLDVDVRLTTGPRHRIVEALILLDDRRFEHTLADLLEAMLAKR